LLQAEACLVSSCTGKGARGVQRQLSAAGDTAAATRAAATKEAVDEAAAKEVAEEAAEKKKAIEAAARKKAAEEAAAKKKVVEEAATKKKASEEATKKTKSGAATAGSGPSPTPSAGVKRAAAPSGSTPLAKRRLLDSWKHRYATRPFICHFSHRICDFNLVSPAYSVPSSGRSPHSRGPMLQVQPKLLSPRTPSKPNQVTRLSVATGSQLPA
jgi:hypothetical protein